MDMQHLFENVVTINPLPRHSKHIIVVGAGGTGGYLIPNLARQVSIQNQLRQSENLPPHTLTVVDADVVESKNLIRQNFVSQDIGKNKASVMASRYSRGYQMNINFVSEYIKEPQQLVNIASANMHGDGYDSLVLIDCVDNNKTRQVFHQFFLNPFSDKNGNFVNRYFLSSGNEEFNGQVIFSMHTHQQNPDSSMRNVLSMLESQDISNMNYNSVNLFDIFPDTLDSSDDFPDEASCADNAVSAPQNIFTNMTAANILFGFMNRLLTEQSRGIEEFAVFFNTKTMTQRVLTSTRSQIKQALQMSPDNPKLDIWFEENPGQLSESSQSGGMESSDFLSESPF